MNYRWVQWVVRNLRKAKLFLLQGNNRASATRRRSLKNSVSMVWPRETRYVHLTGQRSQHPTTHDIYIMYFKTTTFTLHIEKLWLQHCFLFSLKYRSTLIWDGRNIRLFLFSPTEKYFYRENCFLQHFRISSYFIIFQTLSVPVND